MPHQSFLQNLYLNGVADPEPLRSFPALEPGDAARGAVEAFRALASRYPAEDLEREGKLPRAALEEMGTHGLFGMTIPEAFGGMGLSLREYLRVVESSAPLDMSLAMVALAHLSIGVQPIVLYGSQKQKERWLPAAASGQTIFAYALTEPATGSDAQHIRTTARLSEDGTHYLLDGQKTYITNANYAHRFTVFAQIEGAPSRGMGAFVVERDTDGLSVGPDMPKMGLKSSSTAFLRFEEARVPVDNLLGVPGEGFRIAMSVLNYGRLAVCAAGIGMLRQSLADMVRRATQRTQFGKPIAAFELIQEKIARARVAEFVGRCMVDFAARQLEADPTANVAVETSHCKLFCTTRAWQTLYDAQQVAGGSGYLATNPYEKRLRDFRVTTIFEGTTEIHSIYPTLLLMRAIGAALPRGLLGKVAALQRGAWRRIRWPAPSEVKAAARQQRSVRWLTAAFRWRLHMALLFHGEKLAAREFHLRRLSEASMHAYGLLTAAARVRTLADQGTDVTEESELVGAFAGEARAAGRELFRRGHAKRERRLSRIAQRLTAAAGTE